MKISLNPIFWDDWERDVRWMFKHHISRGDTVEQATKSTIKEFSPAFSLDGPFTLSFWLALASAQKDCGLLQDEIKMRALQIIDNAEYLERWQRDPSYNRKRVFLLRLRRKLDAPIITRVPDRRMITQKHHQIALSRTHTTKSTG